MQVANFIIGGTEKAGTTSVFSYLSEHPEVASSRRKETDFFTQAGGTLDDYARFFPQEPPRRIVMEASPAYLGEAEQVAPRIWSMLPNVKLLFIVREPASRLLSSYNFHRARLNLPDDLTFSDYARLCLEYATAVIENADPPDSPLRNGNDWYLKVLLFGCYARFLKSYYELFPKQNILVTFYDELSDDPRQFMERLSGFLGLDPTWWGDADLEPKNVTFSGRSKLLHRAALLVNDGLEPVLRGAPRVKALVTRLYKRVNEAREGYDMMSESDRVLLSTFYAPHNLRLQNLLGKSLPPSWDLPMNQGPLDNGR